MNRPRFDPTHVQITESEAAEILGLTIEELDSRRRSDGHCPKGFRDWEDFPPTTRFRLSDIYSYSEVIMERANPASTALRLNHPLAPGSKHRSHTGSTCKP